MTRGTSGARITLRQRRSQKAESPDFWGVTAPSPHLTTVLTMSEQEVLCALYSSVNRLISISLLPCNSLLWVANAEHHNDQATE